VSPFCEPVDLVIQSLNTQLDPGGTEIKHSGYLLLPAKVGPGLDAQSDTPLFRIFICLLGFFQTA
jgi:hypothetical protein